MTGKVQCTSTGWEVKLAKHASHGAKPDELLLELDATAPTGMAGQMITEQDAKFQQPGGATIQKVTIAGGGPEFSIAVHTVK